MALYGTFGAIIVPQPTPCFYIIRTGPTPLLIIKAGIYYSDEVTN